MVMIRGFHVFLANMSTTFMAGHPVFAFLLWMPVFIWIGRVEPIHVVLGGIAGGLFAGSILQTQKWDPPRDQIQSAIADAVISGIFHLVLATSSRITVVLCALIQLWMDFYGLRYWVLNVMMSALLGAIVYDDMDMLLESKVLFLGAILFAGLLHFYTWMVSRSSLSSSD